MNRNFFLLGALLCSLMAARAAVRTTVYYDGSSASYFEANGGYGGHDWYRNFTDRALTYDKEAHALDYTIRPLLDGRPESLEYWRPNGVESAQRVVVRIRNLGQEPLQMEMGWIITREGVPGTSEGFDWCFPGRYEIPPNAEWQEVSFDMAAAKMGGRGSKELSPLPLFKPFGRFYLHFDATTKGMLRHFQIAEIRGEDDVLCEGKLQWTKPFPRVLKAGEEFEFPGFTVDFTGREPLDPQARLVFRERGRNEDWPEIPVELMDVTKENGRWTVAPRKIALTPFLLDGEYSVSLECGEARMKDANFMVRIQGRKKVEFSRMSVKPFGGRPTMWKGDQPMTGAMRATYTTEGPRGIQAFTNAGIKLFGFCSTPTEGGYNLEMLTEYAPGKYNYQQFDRRMRNTLAVNPDAMLIVRLYLHAPLWWTQEHPDDVDRVCVKEDPSGQAKPFTWFSTRPVPSWSSRAWRDYTNQGLRQMMDFLSKTAYADHIAGFVLASGHTEEWMEWGFDDKVVGDYSPAARKGFRRWLAAKYATDAALQAAWGDENVTLETATMPNAFERYEANYPGIRAFGTPNACRIADYNRFHSENTAECIGEFCQTIKEATDGRLLAGAFYGYFVELSGGDRLPLSGHLGVGKLLKNPYVDYLCSPTGYASRQVGGEGFPYAMGAADSLQLHNKFWFIENDIRTSATPNTAYGRPDDTWGDVLQQTKESIHNLLNGMAQWWFDVGYIRFVDAEVMECIAHCVDVMDRATLEYSREPVAQVAVVLDEASIDWVTMMTPMVAQAARKIQNRLAHMGAPVEVYLAQDLENLPERLRVIILPMSLAWDDAQKAALRKLESQGRVIVFLGTPGVIPQKPGDDRNDSAREFTGLPLSFANSHENPLCLLDAPDGDWLPLGVKGETCSSGGWQDAAGRSVLGVLDANASDLKILGHYRSLRRDNVGGPALGVRERPEASVVFCGVLGYPQELMESIYQKAGVHRYVDSPDQVWASKDIVAICVMEPGVRRISLPKKCRTATDMISGEVFKVDDEQVFCADFLARQTRVFLMQ